MPELTGRAFHSTTVLHRRNKAYCFLLTHRKTITRHFCLSPCYSRNLQLCTPPVITNYSLYLIANILNTWLLCFTILPIFLSFHPDFLHCNLYFPPLTSLFFILHAGYLYVYHNFQFSSCLISFFPTLQNHPFCHRKEHI